MDLKIVKIKDLKMAEYNPRKPIKKDSELYISLRKSIETFGYILPIVINKDMTIIGGHQRVQVLKDLKIKECNAVVVELPKIKEKLLNLALNKITGHWDLQELKNILQSLEEAEIDLEITGFTQDEYEKLVKEFNFEDEIFSGENKELDAGDFEDEKFDHTCPFCGFSFNK